MKKIIFVLAFLFFFVSYGSGVTVAAAGEGEAPGCDSFGYYADKYREYANEDGEKRKITFEEFLTGEAPEEPKDDPSDFSDEITEFWNALPESVRNELPINNDDISSQTDISEKFGFDFFLGFIKNTFKSIFSSLTFTAASVFGAVILSAIIRKLSQAQDGKNGEVISAIISVTICLTVFNTGLLKIESIEYFFSSVSNLSSAILPVMTGLLLSSGNVSGAAVNSGAMTVFSTVIEFLFSKVVVPLTVASMALAIVGCVLSENTSFSLSAFLRKFSNFITLVTMTVFAFVLAVQTSLARSADSIGVKTIKFVIGNFVPIVGGAVSETVNAVDAGLSYIKSTCGTLAVIVIFFMLVPPLVSLLSGRLVLSLSSSVASILGCDTESRLLSELCAVTDCFSALIISSSAVFLLILSSFAAMNPLVAA